MFEKLSKQPGESSTLMELSYTASESDHRRCAAYLAFLCLPLDLMRRPREVIGVTVFGAFGIAYVTYPLIVWLERVHVIPRTFFGDEVSRQLAAFYSAFPVSLILICFGLYYLQLFLTNKRLARESEAIGLPTQLTISSTGLHLQSPFSNSDSRPEWKDVFSLNRKNGDLYILVRYCERSFYIPQSAFADSDAANRLYDALVQLKKAKGNPSAIPPSVLSEFASPNR